MTNECGTRTSYRHGCRCNDCNRANADATLEYSRRRKAGLVPTKPCTHDGCERVAVARSMCTMHYRRWARASGMEKPTPWTDAKRSNYHARRARMNGTNNGDKVLLTAVIERDGSNCAACGTPVDLTLKWPDRMSKSLDHIIPVSKGGEHTLSNAALMHFACNASKGARVS